MINPASLLPSSINLNSLAKIALPLGLLFALFLILRRYFIWVLVFIGLLLGSQAGRSVILTPIIHAFRTLFA